MITAPVVGGGQRGSERLGFWSRSHSCPTLELAGALSAFPGVLSLPVLDRCQAVLEKTWGSPDIDPEGRDPPSVGAAKQG